MLTRWGGLAGISVVINRAIIYSLVKFRRPYYGFLQIQRNFNILIASDYHCSTRATIFQFNHTEPNLAIAGVGMCPFVQFDAGFVEGEFQQIGAFEYINP